MRFLLILALLSPLLCQAKTPPLPEPIFNKLRADFARGKTPTVAQLRLNKAIDCIEFMSNDSKMYAVSEERPELFNLRKLDGIFVNGGTGRVKSYVYDNQLGFSGTAISTEYYPAIGIGSVHHLSVVRATPAGDLISEWSFIPTEYPPTTIKSIVHPSYYATSYSLCATP